MCLVEKGIHLSCQGRNSIVMSRKEIKCHVKEGMCVMSRNEFKKSDASPQPNSD